MNCLLYNTSAIVSFVVEGAAPKIGFWLVHISPISLFFVGDISMANGRTIDLFIVVGGITLSLQFELSSGPTLDGSV